MTHELYQTKKEIESWLNQYQIKKYELIEDLKYGYVVNVNETINLSYKNLEEIKVKFHIVRGNFILNYNKLTSLKGCPNKILGYCSLKGNQLKSLEFYPPIINGTFDCSYNKLETLEYFPIILNDKCYLENNPKLGEIQKITDFNELKKIQNNIKLNQKLEKEISIDNEIKNAKIKL